jgi:putative nucleotidyltransferase with HDIG domain
MAFSLTVAMLFSPELALVSALPLSVLVAYDLPNALELTLFAILSSFFGVIALRRAQRVGSFFSAAGAIALSGIVILVLYRLPEPNTDWLGLLTLCGAAVFNGIASAGVSVLLQFFFAQLLGMTTALQLIELTRPDHALLQFLLRNAPGTYQHSLQVANLAEQAAEQIGADALLTRVGALYHDVGKAANPFFFIENQPPGDLNPHDDLDPALSAATIINHVKDGVELARKFRLPRRIRDFIEEHHGTMFTRYQYVRAVEASGGDDKQVDPNKFRYPGPRPRSRETALVMLADGCEARMRAERPKDEGELLNLIKSVMEKQVKLGELDETNLTLRDLDLIVASFVATLRGVFHPRIEYPQLEARKP